MLPTEAGEAQGEFALKRDTLAGCDLGQNALAAQMPRVDLGMVGRRRQVVQQDVADVRAVIVTADQEALALQLRPIDDWSICEPTVFGERDDEVF